ncbi:hypothetical protein F5Y02DRAFT_195540 [Annulohypoxylon stygium]|nr:hypothetical protein F5Y02DRAFT_195540 [Annulohypoxylon stygium]
MLNHQYQNMCILGRYIYVELRRETARLHYDLMTHRDLLLDSLWQNSIRITYIIYTISTRLHFPDAILHEPVSYTCLTFLTIQLSTSMEGFIFEITLDSFSFSLYCGPMFYSIWYICIRRKLSLPVVPDSREVRPSCIGLSIDPWESPLPVLFLTDFWPIRVIICAGSPYIPLGPTSPANKPSYYSVTFGARASRAAEEP